MRIWAVLELLVRVPAFKAVAGAGDIGQQCHRAIGIACDILRAVSKSAAVQIERDAVAVSLPLSVEGNVPVQFRGEVFHSFLIKIGIAIIVFPPVEGVAGAGEAVVRELLGGVIGEGLGAYDALAAVGVKGHRVFVGRPLGVEGDSVAVLSGEVIHLFPVLVGGAGAIGRRVPPDDSVAGAGEGVGSESLCFVVGESLGVHLPADIVGIVVKYHRVGDGLPLGVDGDVLGHIFVKRIGLGAVLVGIPVLEGVPRPGWVCGLVDLITVFNGLNMHLAAVVVVEGHRVSPMGVESDGAAILRGEVFHALAIVIYNIVV